MSFISNLFSRFSRQPKPTNSQPRWQLRVSGELTALGKTNIDKSGRNPRFMVYGSVLVEKFDLEGAEFEVPPTVDFQGKEVDFLHNLEKEPAIGDKVDLHFAGTNAPRGRFALRNF